MEYTVLRSGRKTVALQIKNGELIVRAPFAISDELIAEFVEAHSGWIQKHLARHEESASILTAKERGELVKRAKEIFPERVRIYAALLGVDYGRISVRFQRTRWGSCSSSGDLSFNCLLLLAPLEVLDSVVAHELCHRKAMNHSAEFYRALESVFPKYKSCRGWLKENGDVLVSRLGEKDK